MCKLSTAAELTAARKRWARESALDTAREPGQYAMVEPICPGCGLPDDVCDCATEALDGGGKRVR